MTMKLLIESLIDDTKTQNLKTPTATSGHDSEKTQTESVIDDYDERVSLIRRAFSEIAKICFWNDYTPDLDDWALLDAARLDPLDYTELRAALRYAYLQIKRKAQAKHANHSGF